MLKCQYHDLRKLRLLRTCVALGAENMPTQNSFPRETFRRLHSSPRNCGLSWLFGPSRAIKYHKNESPMDIEGASSVDELEMNQILGRTLNRTTSTTIRCTLIDGEGRVQISHGEFKRADLISKFGLLPRDLRKLDVSVRNIVPAILVRDSSIVVNLLHIRAIIKQNRILIVDMASSDPDASWSQSLFMYDLEHKLRQWRQQQRLMQQTRGGQHNDDLSLDGPGTSEIGSSANHEFTGTGPLLTYEQLALETILVSVINTLSMGFKTHERAVNSVLTELEQSLDRERLQRLLVQSKTLAAFVQKAKLIRNELEELLDNDKDMAGLYLNHNPPSDDSDVETMLESYYSQCDEIVQNAEQLAGNIRSSEEYINILLDSNRNSLMLLEIRFQVGMLGLGCGSAIAALYGMNLQNMIEDTNWGFIAVSSAVALISFATVAAGLRKLARVEKIKEKFR